ncbi:hypothetical protein [Paeniglutamicibacter gangotriensis]|uniref:Uncharacterized protein n=1 Tax=Paeniglutamicibacter gangotriensis Lz1y TaxID=1276920 RepID=M7MNB1_9MICC|nr:hypothetical protein [Paeniglutamicibacter gangotriensis]EMQ97827.1 hypothetical protein ADIAG_02770 [Paeniglutamicibacter gangotriensis Lz1y]
MPDESPRTVGFDPRAALAEVDGASGAMVHSTEAPRGFALALVLIISTVIALLGVASWPLLLGIGALLVPLGVWYLVLLRNRPKPRPILSHSGPYMLYALLLMLVMQGGRFWEPESWWEVVAKWIVIFAVSWYSFSRMRTSAINNRLKDANERPI